MSIRLLLSLFVLLAVGSGFATSPAEQPVAPDSFEAMVSQAKPEAASRFDRIAVDNGPARDEVCLNIHAFIFKTNDDRVPELVRETTCMPASSTGAKRVNGSTQPKLLPATGGNSF